MRTTLDSMAARQALSTRPQRAACRLAGAGIKQRCLAALLLSCASAFAQDTGDAQQQEDAQRHRIAQLRETYQADLRAKEAACYQRFAVNDCLLEQRRISRDLLADLRRQEVVLNDAQRKRRAARQLLRADEKQHD